MILYGTYRASALAMPCTCLQGVLHLASICLDGRTHSVEWRGQVTAAWLCADTLYPNS